MVIPDLSAPETKPRQNKSESIAIASIADRFLAFILDFLIFSPIISLLIAGMVRHTKTYFLLSPTSQEGNVAAGLVVLMVMFFVTVLQAVFLYYWQATPGQLFLQLRVVPYPKEQDRLSINQSILRSLMFCGGFVLFAIPFLEVVSHPLRRAFHERASDTMVVTLKKNPDEGPLPIESRFIASWMRMSFLFVLLFGVLAFFKTYNSLISGAYREKEAATYACKEIKENDLTGPARLDAALSLFLLNEISPECLEKEAEASLWGDPVNSQELAYLAKFVTTESTEQDKYFDLICKDANSSACALAHYLRDGSEKNTLENADAHLWTTKVLSSEEKYATKDYAGSLQIIEDLQKVPVFKSALEKRYVRSIWALNDELSHTPQRSRIPASTNTQKSWIENFKEKYEVP